MSRMCLGGGGKFVALFISDWGLMDVGIAMFC